MARASATGPGLTAETADYLREAIRQGRFGPGDRIVERPVAEELGVSAITVRDAFARLEREGWIQRLPRRGVRVRRLAPAEVCDIAAARALVEGQAAALAAGNIAAGGDVELRGLLPELGRAAREGDLPGLLALDDAFHAALWRLAASPTLEELLRNLRARVTPLVRLSLETMSSEELLGMERWHAELLGALHAGERAARHAARRHSDLTRDRVLARAARHLESS